MNFEKLNQKSNLLQSIARYNYHGRHTGIDCWKKPKEYEWDRVQRMREEGHYLTLGGQSHEAKEMKKNGLL